MISVCIATYNGEKYLAEQLDSILLQVSEEDELIQMMVLLIIRWKF